MIQRFSTLRRTAAVAVAAASLAGIPQVMAQQPAPAAPTGPMAPERYKNIQVLTNVPADQLGMTMTYISAATGIACVGCHVQEENGQFRYEKDDKRNKQTARQMMKMVFAINAGNFGIQGACATCHQGKNQPAGLPMAEMLTPDQISQMNATPGARGGQAGAGAGAAGGGRGQQPPAPAVDDVLNKYIDAIGGRAALEKLQSLSASGTVTNRAGQAVAFTIDQKANKYRETLQNQPDATIRGFDGTAGWTQVGKRINDLNGFNLDQALRLADLNLALRLKDKYSQLQASGRPIPVNGSPTTVVTGRSGITQEQLFFDASSGLLLRRVITTRTALGPLREQIDYGDYRSVAGIKLPFEIKKTTWNAVDTYKVADAKANAPLPDASFAKPKS